MSEEKTKGQQLQELLFNKRENGVDFMDDAELGVCDDFCEGYKDFLYHCKTEREAAAQALDQARAAGFLPFDEFGDQLEPGAKVYKMNRGKAIILCVKGKRSIKDGVRIAAAHIDSPRIDLKQRPVYEDNGLALFKTHYYGGIKKYQWTAIPLSLHGRICKNDGTYVDVRLGEEPGDPKFCITDILPHLALEQYTRKINELIKGEELNIVIGSRPFKDDKASEKVKLNILNLLYEKYGIVERDLLSAELELVPAFTVDDLGFDRSLIGGYGQDDRSCAYTSLVAQLDEKDSPKKKVWLSIYNSADNFLGSTYKPLLEKYAPLLNLDLEVVQGDGQNESSITNKLGNPADFDAFAINMVKTDNGASYTSILGQ